MATPETGPSESTFSTTSQRTAVLPRTLPRLRRRWLRFSLRTFLLVLTALCIWLGVNVNQARRQKEAVAALKALGATVLYAHQRGEGNPIFFDPRKELDLPRWLRDLTGDDFFQRVAWLYFPNGVTDDGLIHLAPLRGIELLGVA